MKKHDIFEFTAPNGVRVVGAVIECIHYQIDDCSDVMHCEYLCYAQNRLFTYFVDYDRQPVVIEQNEYGDDIIDYQQVMISYSYGKVLVDYCILPDYDKQLEAYYHELDKADDYASKEL